MLIGERKASVLPSITKEGSSMKEKMKRTRAQRDADRELIADLYLHENMDQAEIAVKLNAREGVNYKMSQQMISWDLKQILKSWERETVNFVDEYKAKELQKIDRQEAECWAGWHKSRAVRQRRQVEKSTDAGGETLKGVITTYEPVGDPRFLEEVLRCIDIRCKILGLYGSSRETQTDTCKVYTSPPIRTVYL
jgi:hypothetical protein